jgi:hypothetical protein
MAPGGDIFLARKYGFRVFRVDTRACGRYPLALETAESGYDPSWTSG